jgi:glutamate-ammonia-ligase adenylyltransferase
MDAAFSSIVFAEPGRAETNLERLEQALPGNLYSALPALLAQVPDPDGALNSLERYVAAAPEHVRLFIARKQVTLHHLLLVFSFSRFLSETFIQQPELIQWLHRAGPQASLERIKTPDDLHEEFARFAAIHSAQEPSVVLSRFKRREYVRIMLRDVLGLATLAETAMELSHLADVLLERALRMSEQRLENSYGAPQCVDEQGHRLGVRLTVVSLGKLGAQELNYNSDIDLMFLFGREGGTSGGAAGSIANAEYFTRLAQSLLKLITQVTPEGAVFRVDLRLRPQGGEGDLAVSLPAALEYYRTRAREWELQMLIKARCSAGEPATLRRFLTELRGRIFPPGGVLDPPAIAAVEAVLNARREMTRELRRRAAATEHAAEWNVKLSPGGIRDIEFLTQCLQRVHGGAQPWLAAPAAAPTLVALQRLHDKGFLSGRDFFRLGSAYQFFRLVEHRLQLRDGLQRHTLPEQPDALDRLARRCGIEPAPGRAARAQLLNRLEQHFGEVREIYERVLRIHAPQEGPRTAPEEQGAGDSAILHRLRRDFPGVGRAAEEAATVDDSFARRGLLRFLSSAILEPSCMAQLALHPDWLRRAGEIFARSDLAGELLARFPEELRVVADPGLGEIRGALREEELADESSPASGEDLRRREKRLRRGYRRRFLAAVVRAALGSQSPFGTFEVLSRLADEVIESALAICAGAEGVEREELAELPFAVVALGRLGTREFDVASDADLLFWADESLSPEAREPWRRVAERLVNLLSSHTSEGMLFPADTRLRPHGSQGDIVQSAAFVRDYCAADARAWEALAYLKARPVAGNAALGAAIARQAQEILSERFADAQALSAALLETRRKLAEEAALPHGKGEFKKREGRFYDVEYLIGFHFLSRGVPALAAHTLRQIAALESAGALETRAAQTLRNAALLYRSLDHASRVVTGHAAGRVPESAAAARMLPLLEAWSVPLKGGAGASPAERIADAVRAASEEVRELWRRVLAAGGGAPRGA